MKSVELNSHSSVNSNKVQPSLNYALQAKIYVGTIQSTFESYNVSKVSWRRHYAQKIVPFLLFFLKLIFNKKLGFTV